MQWRRGCCRRIMSGEDGEAGVAAELCRVRTVRRGLDTNISA